MWTMYIQSYSGISGREAQRAPEIPDTSLNLKHSHPRSCSVSTSIIGGQVGHFCFHLLRSLNSPTAPLNSSLYHGSPGMSNHPVLGTAPLPLPTTRTPFGCAISSSPEGVLLARGALLIDMIANLSAGALGVAGMLRADARQHCDLSHPFTPSASLSRLSWAHTSTWENEFASCSSRASLRSHGLSAGISSSKQQTDTPALTVRACAPHRKFVVHSHLPIGAT
ncbi:hypothetical protein C8Q74DRAFT_344051 [Fomes fomentarius]|nr:hypothetical protein C8Q74DRAFT_344051 [Fomes fomentarius]